jgi:hypothetical protein
LQLTAAILLANSFAASSGNYARTEDGKTAVFDPLMQLIYDDNAYPMNPTVAATNALFVTLEIDITLV